jgi:TolB-like protein/DNA-binding winged helix-turn-helix (wHTH) protein/Flp pilus assembly protein TadD
MDPGTSADTTLLDRFRFDRRGGGLFHLESGAQVAIGSRALDILGVLIERSGKLVSKDEIVKAVWPHSTVDDSNLPVQISTLRRVLDSGGPEGSSIQTVPGRGYRFVGSVTWGEPEPRSVRETSFSNGHDTAFANQASAGVVSAEVVDTGHSASVPKRRGLWLRFAGLFVAFCLVGAEIFWSSDYRWFREPTALPRLSIVVLPFKNLSNDPGQQYFADGITENLTIDLSRITGIFVISRNTAFTYKDKPINAKQIGRELGVRYALEGSVQRSAKQVRVNVQLIDAEADAHLWAERFDLDIGDLLALQNEITSRIAIALNRALIGAEAARRPPNPDAVDYIFRARAASFRPPTPDSYVERIGLYERALALDPGSAEATTQLAVSLTGRVLVQLSSDPNADLARAQELLGQVPTDTFLAHWAKGQLLRAQGRITDAIPEYEAAIALNPNFPSPYGNLAQTKLLTGSFEEVAPLIEQAIRLSPRDPELGYWDDLIGLTHLLQSRTDEAIVWLEKARSASPTRPFIHADLAAAYGLKGDGKRAVAELAEARRLSVNPVIYSSIARLGRLRQSVQKVRVLFEATYLPGMRKAGMVEE